MIADAQDRPNCPPARAAKSSCRGDVVMPAIGATRKRAQRRCEAAGSTPATSAHSTRDGYLTLKDRSKDLIISGGSNIYPREVEEVLLQAPAACARRR